MAKKKTYDRIQNRETQTPVSGDFEVPQSKVMAPPPFAPMASDSSSAGFHEEEEQESGVQLKAASDSLFADADPPVDGGSGAGASEQGGGNSGSGGMEASMPQPAAPVLAASLESKGSQAAVQLQSGGVVQRHVDHPGVELHNHYNGILSSTKLLEMAEYSGSEAQFVTDLWNAADKPIPGTIEALLDHYQVLDQQGNRQVIPEAIAPVGRAVALALLQAGPNFTFDAAYLVRDWLSSHRISRKDQNENRRAEIDAESNVDAVAGRLNEEAGDNPAERRVIVYAEAGEEVAAAIDAGATAAGGNEMMQDLVVSKTKKPKRKKGEPAPAPVPPQFDFDRFTTLPKYMPAIRRYGGSLGPYNLLPTPEELLPNDSSNWAVDMQRLQAMPRVDMLMQAGEIGSAMKTQAAAAELDALMARLRNLGREPLGAGSFADTRAFNKIRTVVDERIAPLDRQDQAAGRLGGIARLEDDMAAIRIAVASLQQMNADGLRYVEYQGSAGIDRNDLAEMCEMAGVELHFLMTLSTTLLGGAELRSDQSMESIAEELRAKGLDGIDFAGAEAKFHWSKGPAFFKAVYEMLAELGKKHQRAYVLRPHAGEGYPQRERDVDESHRQEANQNVSAIVRALDGLAAEGKISPHVILRIGHATHAFHIHLDKLRSYGVIVEANLGSNAATGSANDTDQEDEFAPTEKENVLLKFLFKGVETVLNTDGGGVIGTDIQQEYDQAGDIIERFRNNQIGFILPLTKVRFWFSEIPALIDQSTSPFQEQLLGPSSQPLFDVRRLAEMADQYRRQQSGKLKDGSMA